MWVIPIYPRIYHFQRSLWMIGTAVRTLDVYVYSHAPVIFGDSVLISMTLLNTLMLISFLPTPSATSSNSP